MTQELKWSKFSHYKYSNGFLFLLIGDTFSLTFTIDEKYLTREDFDSLLDFVKRNL